MDRTRTIIDLLKLITNIKTTDKELISFIESNKIHVNTYLPCINNDGEMPLIFYCCSTPRFPNLFNYLVERNVDVTAEMNTKDPIELLYYSQTEYIPTLISRGAVLSQELFKTNGKKLLIGGNIKKLMVLYKYGAIQKSQLTDLINIENLIFDICDRLYERMFFICKNSDSIDVFTKNYKDTMKNYLDCYKLIFMNGTNINQVNANGELFFQQILNTYFTPLIEELIKYEPNLDVIDVIHHSNFDLNNRIVMRYFYNNENYEKIKEIINPLKIPQKIIIKNKKNKK